MAGVELRAPEIPFVSNVTGTWISRRRRPARPRTGRATCAQTVRFADGVATLREEPGWALLEAGPRAGAGRVGPAAPARTARRAATPSSARCATSTTAWTTSRFLLETLGGLWSAGVTVDWTAFSRGERRHRIPLPGYPFERQRYWVDPPARARRGAARRWTSGGRRSRRHGRPAEPVTADRAVQACGRRDGVAADRDAAIRERGGRGVVVDGSHGGGITRGRPTRWRTDRAATDEPRRRARCRLDRSRIAAELTGHRRGSTIATGRRTSSRPASTRSSCCRPSRRSKSGWACGSRSWRCWRRSPRWTRWRSTSTGILPPECPGRRRRPRRPWPQRPTPRRGRASSARAVAQPPASAMPPTLPRLAVAAPPCSARRRERPPCRPRAGPRRGIPAALERVIAQQLQRCPADGAAARRLQAARPPARSPAAAGRAIRQFASAIRRDGAVRAAVRGRSRLLGDFGHSERTRRAGGRAPRARGGAVAAGAHPAGDRSSPYQPREHRQAAAG